MRGFFTAFAFTVGVIVIIGFFGLLMYPELLIVFEKVNNFLGG